ncbi:MAG: hypothetical protein HDR15_03455 [Lachnospiraceae bacterium]|nr:hypothetical protein [Lachnospiraceae bacterium]
MDEKKETFHYTYSASQQQEIKRIREKYAPPTQEEDKMEKLRRLDRSATKAGGVISLTVGTISSLILGIGMCCTMVWAGSLFIPGIVIGMVGIIGMIAAYPIFIRVTKKRRERVAPEILRLSDELLK